KISERKNLQDDISKLTKKQQTFVGAKRKDMAATKTLDNVMVDAVRRQASENGFSY
ncbi:MAG: hypothetical protein JKX72_04820, partial [Robiginitomaculum sp.]|nr:hypothetical protein [Robiginitomaculum sp.]